MTSQPNATNTATYSRSLVALATGCLAINQKTDGEPDGLFNSLVGMIGRVALLADSGSDLRQKISRIGDDAASLRKVDVADLEEDDPIVRLGALFVLSSLMEHGELQPELKA